MKNHEFEREQRAVYNRIWMKVIKGRKDNLIIISKIKEGRVSIKVI